MFSHRLPTDLAPNRLSTALAALRREGRPFIDLTESNPTRTGLKYPADLLAPLADRRALVYRPEPFGLLEARRAVAADYERRALAVAADRIVLTPSTSDAYSLLFKVLCDPFDEVLVPRPSYPLFEHLTQLDAVRARPYDLEYHGDWFIDFASLERAWSARTRAVLVVTPNNPTGSFAKPEEIDRLAALCAAREAAIIADEVFADYELVPGRSRAAAKVLARRDVLAFGLGGLSKSIGLPQAKLAWFGVAGPDTRVEAALARLEFACDTYLSVSTPVQIAASELLARGAAVREQIRSRIVANCQQLTARAAETPACSVLQAEGGWYAVVRVPSFGSEEDLALNLLTTDAVLAHPGYFFNFPNESYLIVSLLVPEAQFSQGIVCLLRRAAAPTAMPSERTRK